MSQLYIRDIMSPEVPFITPDTELTDAICLLQQYQLIGSPVVDNNKHLLGFISEQQLLKPLLQSSYFCDGKVTVAELMSESAVSVQPNNTVIDLAEAMLGNKPKVYPVVEENKVIGLVTRSQIVSALKLLYLSCAS
ncbi:CBS domain-containing protein [Pseudoalteromonas sp. T1lg65]|uniref:CBS domain-containing protein n=1 Tax=Pseudoalteromonas sp. T1lg65 TaxID=2077101 RepID=UPI003F79BAC0